MRLLINVTLATDERMEVCAEAANATDAVIQATKFQPELVILDHFIEGDVMGLQAAPLIKQAAPDAKILMFTSHDLSAEVRRDDAVDGFLRKSQISVLLPTAQRLVGLEPAS